MKQQVSHKFWWLSSRLHGVTSHKTGFFTFAAVRTSNLTLSLHHKYVKNLFRRRVANLLLKSHCGDESLWFCYRADSATYGSCNWVCGGEWELYFKNMATYNFHPDNSMNIEIFIWSWMKCEKEQCIEQKWLWKPMTVTDWKYSWPCD